MPFSSEMGSFRLFSSKRPFSSFRDTADGHNGEGQSSHVLVFCVNLGLWEIISFTLKSNYYVPVALSGLPYIYCLTKLLLQARNFFYR